MSKQRKRDRSEEDASEIGVIGDLSEHEAEICDKLINLPLGSECTLYFNSPGGGAYTGLALLALIVLRDLRATGVVLGECSSAALWPLAACRRRLVTPFSVLLFHPLRWQSEESVQLAEAREWARHFGDVEQGMDRLLAEYLNFPLERLSQWMKPGRYVSGPEFAGEGLAELIDLSELKR